MKSIRFFAALLALLCLLPLGWAEEAPAPTPTPLPVIDPTQTRYTDEPAATPTPRPGETETYPAVSLYCIGDSFAAKAGDDQAACDVRNKPFSTHDILMRWYITESELTAHGLSAEGLPEPEAGEEPRWTIAETGLFEPGYHITSVRLRALPDGSFLPAGVYHLILVETYYDRMNGQKFPLEPTIPITLTILE